MTRESLARQILPVAMTAALVGTAWIGIAGGTLISGAQAQRPENKKEEEDRRKRGQPPRQERPAPRTTPASPPAAGHGKRAAEPPKGAVAPPPKGAVAPQLSAPSRPERATPDPVPRTKPGIGKAPPPATPPGTSTQPPRQATPQPAPLPRRDDPRSRPDFGKSPRPSAPGQPPRAVAPQPQPPASRDDSRRDQARPVPKDLPGKGPDRDRDRDRAGDRDRDRDRAGDRDRDRDRAGDRDRDRDRAGDRDRARRDGPLRLEDVKKGRVERVEGERRIIEEPGNRFIIREKGRTIIRRDEGRAFERYAPNARTRDLEEGRRETVIERSDGSRVYTVVDRNGRLLRRYRRDRSGREIVLIDNRRFYRNVGIGLGVTALGIGVGLALAPPAFSLPRAKYIVEYDDASEDDLYEALSSPPVARLERPYSLEEIRYSQHLREYMRRIDLDTINFEFGSFEVAPDQYPKLERLARIIQRLLRRNEAEVILIEGHTDAVGTEDDNLTLGDHRAESVATILISEFGIPVENLVTQGYGEQFLKVETEAPERQNRRVAIRRITPLLGLANR